jgi:hypothetical protein
MLRLGRNIDVVFTRLLQCTCPSIHVDEDDGTNTLGWIVCHDRVVQYLLVDSLMRIRSYHVALFFPCFVSWSYLIVSLSIVYTSIWQEFVNKAMV